MNSVRTDRVRVLYGRHVNGNGGPSIAMSRLVFFFFSSRRRHTRLQGDWSSDVCSSDLIRFSRGPQEGRSGARLNRMQPPDPHSNTQANDQTWTKTHHRTEDPGGAAAEIGRASCRERV